MRERFELEARCFVDQFVGVRGSVQEAEVGMAVQLGIAP